MRPPLRIAILECDTPLPDADSRYNGYGGVFTALLKSSAKTLNQSDRFDSEIDLQISRWDIMNGIEYPKLEDVDAVLLSGSRYNSYEDVPWINRLVEFTQSVLAQDRVRLLGICFGHQIVARALGTKVCPSDQGWEIAVCDVDLTPEGKELFGRNKLRIQQVHQDIVYECPPGVTLLGSSPRCAVQGMYSRRRFITVQGHPEFNEEIEDEIIKHLTEEGVLSETQAQEALSRVGNEYDGVFIGATFLKFLTED
ncbi:hypothetical protein PENSUB_2384 [Penicillium subrubescens]|uniref:Glutamine amidotransferase domain-containing protein n=2 Tax=Penicillium subrubescens TaxID=1316194 RepID=A0A1Q5UHS0_9EURO|nr:hypothetical protein PENSUB_2384 [Penicillium subrubescens]